MISTWLEMGASMLGGVRKGAEKNREGAESDFLVSDDVDELGVKGEGDEFEDVGVYM